MPAQGKKGIYFLRPHGRKNVWCQGPGLGTRSQQDCLSVSLYLSFILLCLSLHSRQMDHHWPQRPLIAFGATCKDRFDPLHPGCKQAGEYLVGPAWVRRSLSDPVISEPGREKGRGWGWVSQKRDCFQERRILVASQWGQTPQLSVQRNPEPGWGFLEDTERAQQLKGLRHLRPVPDHKT